MTKQVVYDSEPFRLGSSLRIQSVQEKAEPSVTLSRHVAYFFRPRQRALLFLVTDQAKRISAFLSKGKCHSLKSHLEMCAITSGPGSEILGNTYGQKNIRPPVGSRDSTI